ncbi:MAG: type II toxin-antitoxin system VapC family toxin [Candidatus Hydrothermarchaeaceae archaeon]
MVCLDTSFIVALIRGDLAAERKLEGYVADEVRLTTTPITACELFKGAYRSERRDIQLKKVKGLLRYLEILDFSIDVCERYGKLVNELQRTGNAIGDLDAIIASVVLTHNETIVTRDLKHFEKVPSLLIETW